MKHTLTDPPKLTRAQQAVLDLLRDVSQAIAAQDLFMMLRQTRSIGLATVYRSLETLKTRGLVKCVTGQPGEALYSLVGQDVHHLKCLSCDQSVQLENCPLSGVTQELQTTQQFKIYYHTLDFFGVCPDCQRSQQ
ncbi:transcriptional repressor [filamentous cyanobacterium LEGE 11480]|uniref:Transcriptional repressor n=1 Tax=Romeriopsis navalis LEGE 11480 TaxID=2777977 RepID=A0A928VLQ0_9CYAN|nr:Fur family transcriptional regulator [Romeriopsis navalis]MBE9028931.1 transcriptional repressor [Romeriopsis navalis LEGE 11480]